MPGRHAQQPDRTQRRRAVLVAAGLGLALLVGGGLAWGMTQPTRATTVANEVAPSTAPAPPDAQSGGDRNGGAANTPPATLVACARALDSGATVVESAVPSRDHWGGHVQAQLDYDSRTITAQQMVETFAATKASGAADLAAFDTAHSQYQPVGEACGGMDRAAMTERWRPMAAACSARAGVTATAVQASEAVVGDWRAHVEMMKNKSHTDPNAYGTMWRDMIAKAPANLNGFTAARDALGQQTPCQASSS
jgi:hypothetical protein